MNKTKLNLLEIVLVIVSLIVIVSFIINLAQMKSYAKENDCKYRSNGETLICK